MSLFALIVALLFEQLKPLTERKELSLSAYAGYFQHHCNSGEYRHGKAAWLLAVLPPVIFAIVLYWVLYSFHPLLAMSFNVLVLYLCMGFGRHGRDFTEIQQAMRRGEPQVAREIVSRLYPFAAKDDDELARIAIEVTLVSLHRHLFGVIVWYALFSLLGLGGAAGALLYRLGLALCDHWQGSQFEHTESKFDVFAGEMRQRLEWLPVRLTASTFAVVGNFEDTAYCWRAQAASWPDREVGILLASAAGASGVRLGAGVDSEDRPELGVGDKTEDAALQSAGRLVWRSVVFMLVMLFMLTLASLLG